MELYHLVYVSIATHEMSDDELKALLVQARDKNQSRGITGMLLYKKGFFMQALEGEQNVVEERFKVISKDSRHESVSIICENSISARKFPNWSMGFNKIDQNSESLVGFSDFLTSSSYQFFEQSPSRAEDLLDLFRHDCFF